MRNQRLITLFVILFLSISNAQEQFESYKDIEKIPNGMNIIHDNARTQAIVGIHGFYPIYWIEIHHEWVQPFNFLINKDIRTFFYKYDWNECPSKVAEEFSIELKQLIEKHPEIDDWQIVGHSMGGSVVMFVNKLFPYNEKITFNTVATPVYYEREKTPLLMRIYESIFKKRYPKLQNKFTDIKNKLAIQINKSILSPNCSSMSSGLYNGSEPVLLMLVVVIGAWYSFNIAFR